MDFASNTGTPPSRRRGRIQRQQRTAHARGEGTRVRMVLGQLLYVMVRRMQRGGAENAACAAQKPAVPAGRSLDTRASRSIWPDNNSIAQRACRVWDANRVLVTQAPTEIDMTDRPRAPHGPSDCAGPLDVSRGRLKPEIDADMVDPVWRMLNWSAPGVVLVASLIAPGPEPRRDDRTVAPDSAAVASAKIAVTSQPWLQPKAILTNATSVGFRRTDFH